MARSSSPRDCALDTCPGGCSTGGDATQATVERARRVRRVTQMYRQLAPRLWERRPHRRYAFSDVPDRTLIARRQRHRGLTPVRQVSRLLQPGGRAAHVTFEFGFQALRGPSKDKIPDRFARLTPRAYDLLSRSHQPCGAGLFTCFAALFHPHACHRQHIRSILNKLEFNSSAQIAAWMAPANQ